MMLAFNVIFALLAVASGFKALAPKFGIVRTIPMKGIVHSCPPLKQASKDAPKGELTTTEQAKKFLSDSYDKVNAALSTPEAQELLAKSKVELEKQLHRAVEKGTADVHTIIEAAQTPEAQDKLAEWKTKVTHTLHEAMQKGGESIKQIAEDSKKK